jgi:hypothetical protein
MPVDAPVTSTALPARSGIERGQDGPPSQQIPRQWKPIFRGDLHKTRLSIFDA